ncbi:MAG: hypothetical protein Q7J54_02370 [Candidatus Woesearchaeota archaeon]|nr:hypothetical protein [Candidatus Woesearchaeota archaeon]
MSEPIIDQDIPLAEDKRLVKKLWKVDKTDYFPHGLEFAYQFLYFKDNEWIQVARIDNQLHEGKAGVHIHILKREEVRWEELTFEQAEEKILEIGEGIVRNIINKI